MEPPSGQIRELETRSGSYDDHCLPHQLGGPTWICLFPHLPDRQMSQEGENGTRHSCTSSTPMAKTTLVPNVVGVDNCNAPVQGDFMWGTREDNQLAGGTGTTINYPKSQTIPAQKILFLGFLVDYNLMKLFLLKEKIQSIAQGCQWLMKQPTITIHQLSQLLRTMTAAAPAILSARYGTIIFST